MKKMVSIPIEGTPESITVEAWAELHVKWIPLNAEELEETREIINRSFIRRKQL